jgi:hypothetical protein
VTIYRVLSLLARLFGFVQMAGHFWHLHELKIKAQEIANTPTTRAELEKTLKDGEL